MPEKCPNCGRDDFDSEDEREGHVDACESKWRAEQPAEADGGTEPDSKPPAARAESPNVQRAGGAGAVEELSEAGEVMASGLSGALDEDAPLEQRKDGVKQLGSLLSGVVNGVMDYKERKEARKEERARNADLEPTTDKPSCECGLTFTEIPERAERISCPECGREYEVR